MFIGRRVVTERGRAISRMVIERLFGWRVLIVLVQEGGYYKKKVVMEMRRLLEGGWLLKEGWL